MRTIEAVRAWLKDAPRGLAAQVCQDTVLTAPEISRFTQGRRDLPADKMLVLIDWLEARKINWRNHV